MERQRSKIKQMASAVFPFSGSAGSVAVLSAAPSIEQAVKYVPAAASVVSHYINKFANWFIN